MKALTRIACALALCAGGLAAAPAPASAHVGVFFGFSPGFFYAPPVYAYPPPVYYPPPAYYPPPPVDQWYTPPPPPPVYGQAPAVTSPAAAQSCNAGAYVCPMETPVSPGTTCWCPNNRGGRTYGHAS